MRSGLNVPTPAIPMPDFAVPYAAPALPKIISKLSVSMVYGEPVVVEHTAKAIPACSLY
jgi:hypothetical protein